MIYNTTSELITIDELCDALMIGRNTAYRLLNNKQIAAFKIGRTWKIPRSSVNYYLHQKCNPHPPHAFSV